MGKETVFHMPEGVSPEKIGSSGQKTADSGFTPDKVRQKTPLMPKLFQEGPGGEGPSADGGFSTGPTGPSGEGGASSGGQADTTGAEMDDILAEQIGSRSREQIEHDVEEAPIAHPGSESFEEEQRDALETTTAESLADYTDDKAEFTVTEGMRTNTLEDPQVKKAAAALDEHDSPENRRKLYESVSATVGRHINAKNTLVAIAATSFISMLIVLMIMKGFGNIK